MITVIVATNIVASRPSKWQLTATPNARANKNRGGNISNTKNADFFIATTRRFYIIYKLFPLREAVAPQCNVVTPALSCTVPAREKVEIKADFVWGLGNIRLPYQNETVTILLVRIQSFLNRSQEV